MLVKLSDSLYLGAIGKNLTDAKNGFLPLRVGGGLGFTSETFTLEADGLADFTTWSPTTSLRPTARLMVGGEYVANSVVPIRAGFDYNQGAGLSGLSVGSGFLSSMFSAEVSVRRTLWNSGYDDRDRGIGLFF